MGRVAVRKAEVRRLGTVGVVGVSFFAVVTVLLPLAQQPGHDVARSSISALALGSWGWLQAVAFVVLGVGTVAIALVLHGSRLGRMGPAMVVVSGLLDLVIAVFPTAPEGAAIGGAAAVHTIAATGSLVLMVLVMFVMARPFGRDAGWRRLAGPSVAWGVSSAGVFLAVLATTGLFGLAERLLVFGTCSWLALTAGWSRRITASRH